MQLQSQEKLMKMNGDYLLDSNIIVDIFRGEAKAISRVKKLSVIRVSVITIGELHYGAKKSNQTPKRESEIKQLEEMVNILDITKSTAKIYGQIKDQLRAKGKPIPENDIWIAATVMEHQLTLLTKDKHFENVEGLVIEEF